jgi:NTE family protein
MKHCLFSILLFAINTIVAQPRIENLVFEGAGIRGIAYSGAIQVLEQQHVLTEVKRVGGTSAGAIIALMIALGYNAQEITSITVKTNYKKFNDGSYFFAGGLNRMKNFFGWYRGKEFEKWLAEIIDAKAGDNNLTFTQMKQKGFRDLYVTGTSLNQQRLIVFSYENFPDMKVKDAVRISMSIPLYFEAVFIDSTGNIIKHPKNKEGVNIMVDGGLVSNFPIRLFDSTKYVSGSSENIFIYNEQTLGFRIDNAAQIANDSTTNTLAPMRITNLKEYTSAFYNIIIENLNRQALTKKDWERTVSINDGNISPRIRRLSNEEIKTLITNGEKAAANYLNKRLNKN